MSGGEYQRGAIVRVLANTPQIVLADEPTGSLDSRSRPEVFALLWAMDRGMGVAIVMVGHSDHLAQAVDHLWLIEDGRLRELPRGTRRVYKPGPTRTSGQTSLLT